MTFRLIRINKSAGPLRRALQYGLYDWASDMTWSMRLLTTIGILIQAGALRGNGKETMQVLERLVDSKFNEDDITILPLRRVVGTTAALLPDSDRTLFK